MIIYNTTYSVSDKIYNSFLKWLKEKHVSQMTETGFFEEPRISKVLTEEEQDGVSVSVQFSAKSLDAVADWNDQYGDLFRMEISSLFSEQVLYFSTFLEVIE